MLSAAKIQSTLADSKVSKSEVIPFDKRCYQAGIYHLQHVTYSGFLADILSNGFLLPHSKQTSTRHQYYGGNDDLPYNPKVCYLSPYVLKGPDCPVFDTQKTARRCEFLQVNRISEFDVVLMFSANLLAASSDYYANKGWNSHGKYTADSMTAASIVSSPSILNPADEICFTKGIDLSKYLVEIWVAPGKKTNLVKTLPTAIAAKWATKMVEQEFHPEITMVNASVSKPQRMKDAEEIRNTASVRLFKKEYPENDSSSKAYKRTCRSCF